MIVPDRELRRCDQQARKRGMRALPAVARRHRHGIELVERLEIQVVAEPQHDVRRLVGNRVEDLVAAAVRARVPRRLGRREKEARADRDRDVARLALRRPVRLRADGAALHVAVAFDRVRGTRAGCETREPGEHDIVVRRARVDDRFVLDAVVLGEPAKADRPRRIRLHPYERARIVGVAVHDDEPRMRASRAQREQEKRDACFQDEVRAKRALDCAGNPRRLQLRAWAIPSISRTTS